MPPTCRIEAAGRRVQRAYRTLSVSEVKRVNSAIDGLAHDLGPPGCQKLSASNTYRIRVGPLRIIYRIDDRDRRVILGAISRRSEQTYKRIDDLFG